MYKHILLPTDGSELSERAIKSAIALAKSVKARVTGFYVVEGRPIEFPATGYLEDPGRIDFLSAREQQEKVAKQVAQRCLDVIETEARKHGVPCECHYAISLASPSEEIIKASIEKGCDLIFMATHGRKGVAAMMLGSQTKNVLTDSIIPVLAYRSA